MQRHGIHAGNDCVYDLGPKPPFLPQTLLPIFPVRSMRRILTVLDESGDGELDRIELTHGFRNLGIELSPQVGDIILGKM